MARKGDGTGIALLSVLALAGAAAAFRGSGASRNADPRAQIERALALVPELVLRWVNHENGTDLTDPNEVESFHLSDLNAPPKQVLDWWARETGLTYVGQGNQRVVFRLVDGSVLKLALDDWGREGNEREIETWREAQGDLEVLDLLVPILSGNEDFIHMAGADPLSSARLRADPQLAARFMARLKVANNFGWEGRLMADDFATPMNWGIHDGEIKILDYEAAQ